MSNYHHSIITMEGDINVTHYVKVNKYTGIPGGYIQIETRTSVITLNFSADKSEMDKLFELASGCEHLWHAMEDEMKKGNSNGRKT